MDHNYKFLCFYKYYLDFKLSVKWASQLFISCFFAFIVFIWDKNRIIYLGATVLLNVIAFIVLELSFPDLVVEYPTQLAKTIDIYIGLIISLVIIVSYTWAAKQNYRIQYLKAQRADQLKSVCLSNMTHEIRTPLNSIVGFTQLHLENYLTEEKKKRFSNIVNINNLFCKRYRNRH